MIDKNWKIASFETWSGVLASACNTVDLRNVNYSNSRSEQWTHGSLDFKWWIARVFKNISSLVSSMTYQSHFVWKL